jgi:[acyl-carrier-protein] S-malonyltransferase
MAVDPYFVTQDNGMGAPIHFATTYGRLDMVGSWSRTSTDRMP